MKRSLATAAAIGCAAMLAGCAGANMDSLTQAGGSLFTAATLSDANVKQLSDQSCADMDKKNTLATADSSGSQAGSGATGSTASTPDWATPVATGAGFTGHQG